MSLCGLCLAVSLAAADISGKWSLVWDTEGGIRRTEWIVTQNGENLKVQTDDGQVLSGTMHGDELALEGKFRSSEAGYTSTLKLEGQLSDGKLSGKGTWDQYAMTFTGTRGE